MKDQTNQLEYDLVPDCMHMAAQCGSPADIASLLSKGADINARNQHGSTPLHWAASQCADPATIAALIEAGADIEARDVDGDTPLHHAATVGTPDNITALINAGADINARNVDGKTPLDAANQRTDNTAARILRDATEDMI